MHYKHVGNVKSGFLPYLSMGVIGLVAIVSGLLLSCNGGEDGGTETVDKPQPTNVAIPVNIVIKSIAITPLESLSVTKGQELSLSIDVEYSDDSTQTITEDVDWRFEPQDAVSVGELTAKVRKVIVLKAGALKVVAIFKEMQSPPITINVVDPSDPILPAITSIAIDNVERSSLRMGDKIQLKVKSNLGDLLAEEVTWRSSHPTLITVSDGGAVEVINVGVNISEVIITATYLGVVPSVSGTLALTILPFHVAIQVLDEDPEWPVGVSKTLQVLIDYNDGKEAQIQQIGLMWNISHPDLMDGASASNGEFKALAAGNVDIYVEFEGVQSDPMTISVVPARLQAVFLTPEESVVLDIGERQLFTPRGTLTDKTEVADISDQVTCVSSQPDVFQFIDGCEGEALAIGQIYMSVEPTVDTYKLANSSRRLVVVSKAVHLGRFDDTQSSQTFTQTIPEFVAGDEPNSLYLIRDVIPGNLYTLIVSSKSPSLESQFGVAMESGAENVCSQSILFGQEAYCSFQAKTEMIFIDIVDEAEGFVADFSLHKEGSVHSPSFTVVVVDETLYSIFDGVDDELYTYKLTSVVNESVDLQDSILIINHKTANACSNTWPQNRQSVACVVRKQAGELTNFRLSLSNSERLPELKLTLDITQGGFENEGPIQLALDVEHEGQILVNSSLEKNHSLYEIGGLKMSANPGAAEEDLIQIHYVVELIDLTEVVMIEVRRLDRSATGSPIRSPLLCRIETYELLDVVSTEVLCTEKFKMTNESTALEIKIIGRDGFAVSPAASQGGASYKIVVRQKLL